MQAAIKQAQLNAPATKGARRDHRHEDMRIQLAHGPVQVSRLSGAAKHALGTYGAGGRTAQNPIVRAHRRDAAYTAFLAQQAVNETRRGWRVKQDRFQKPVGEAPKDRRRFINDW